MKHLIYRSRFKLREWVEYAGEFPVHIDIELAGKCQLACTMCPYGTGDFDSSKQGMMPLDMAMEAIQQAAAGGASSIKFNFRGEPALHKGLEACVKEAKRRGIVETAINTNLTAFTYTRLESLVKAGIDLIIISIDGSTKKTYEKIRVKGDWEKLLENFYFLCNLVDNAPKIRVQVVKQDDNLAEIDAGLFDDLFYFPGRVDLVIQNLRSDNKGERRRCPQPWQRLVVAWDGRVFACCSNWDNEWPVGQFPQTSLSDIWNGSASLKILRHRAKYFNYEPCASCTVGASYK